jgi:hypothetical protein
LQRSSRMLSSAPRRRRDERDHAVRNY